MAIKQHCDICDSVIPGEESFRVIRYGRGQNLDVQTGLEPKIICKACWGKMWAAVSTEEVKNINGILANMIPENRRGQCEDCKYCDEPPDEYPCSGCVGYVKWRPKDETQSDV